MYVFMSLIDVFDICVSCVSCVCDSGLQQRDFSQPYAVIAPVGVSTRAPLCSVA